MALNMIKAIHHYPHKSKKKKVIYIYICERVENESWMLIGVGDQKKRKKEEKKSWKAKMLRSFSMYFLEEQTKWKRALWAIGIRTLLSFCVFPLCAKLLNNTSFVG